MGKMRHPSLSLHGIEGAFSGPGAKTVIPAKVSGKFSIRSVPYIDTLWIRLKIFEQTRTPSNSGKGRRTGSQVSPGGICQAREQEQDGCRALAWWPALAD